MLNYTLIVKLDTLQSQTIYTHAYTHTLFKRVFLQKLPQQWFYTIHLGYGEVGRVDKDHCCGSTSEPSHLEVYLQVAHLTLSMETLRRLLHPPKHMALF